VPEFKTCKYTTEAIVSDGIDKGELRKVCTEPTCPVHHSKKQTPKADASLKAEHEKRHEEALANATGNRVLKIEFAGEVSTEASLRQSEWVFRAICLDQPRALPAQIEPGVTGAPIRQRSMRYAMPSGPPFVKGDGGGPSIFVETFGHVSISVLSQSRGFGFTPLKSG